MPYQTFSYSPDYGASVDKTPSIIEFRFGDGYSQRFADGINTKPKVWNVQFVRDPSTISTIESFLNARNATEAFQWTDPDGYTGIFLSKQWSVTVPDVGWKQLSSTFEEVFE